MEKKDLIYLATKAHSKRWGYEKLKYSDDLYDNEQCVDDVWPFVEEIESIGTIAFREKYKDYELFPY